MYSQYGGADDKPKVAAAATTTATVGVEKRDLNEYSVKSLLKQVGVESGNLDDLLKGSKEEVENRIITLKSKLSSHKSTLDEKKTELESYTKQFNENLNAQIKLYEVGGNKDDNSNLFSQLKVRSDSFGSSYELKVSESREVLNNKLNGIRIFEEKEYIFDSPL